MGRKSKFKHPKPGTPNVPPQATGGGAIGGAAGYTASPGDKLVAFFRRQILPLLALSFLLLMLTLVWFFFPQRLGTAMLAALLITLALGGVFWFLKKRTDHSGDDAQLLNGTHDRHDRPDRPGPEEELESLITQASPMQAGWSSEYVTQAELGRLKDALKALVIEFNGVKGRLAELEQEVYYSTRSKPSEERKPRTDSWASTAPKRSTPAYNSYEALQPSRPSLDLSTLNQAVSRFLADQTGSWEIERLVHSVRDSMDGNATIDVEHLGSYSSGEWRLAALWPRNSQEGLVLVSSGELVDDDIAKYFDVGYGRRIIGCKQPARVARSGGEVTVLQKGRVESS